MKSLALWLCATLLVFVGATQTVHAQVITNAEIERGLRSPGTPSHDGEPYTQRYSYGTGNGIFYLNGDSRRLYYLDYLDRADRAEKFGYRMPVDPYFEAPPAPRHHAPVRAYEPMPGDPVMEMPPPPQYAPVRVFFGMGGFWRRR